MVGNYYIMKLEILINIQMIISVIILLNDAFVSNFSNLMNIIPL